MRPSLLPQRPLRRVCDACKQQRRHATSTTIANAAPTSSLVQRKSLYSRESTFLRPTPQRAHISANTGPSFHTRRHIASSSSSAQGTAAATTTTEQGKEHEQEQHTHEHAKIEQQTGSKPISHYDLFPQTLPRGPPPSGPFAIDVRALRREFLTLQASAHPDLAPHGASSKRRAEAASARINEAYRTLADPLARAQYLLREKWGVDAAGEETARVEDPELLMLVLETREMIEDAGAEEELEPLARENEGRIRESEERLARAFERDDREGARREVTRLRYWVNIRDAIRDWEEGKPVVLQH
ncbi:Co-chaperone Hsc20 [Daldinia caldariorum]|uniref:Co-chaperone Hsc20 n=1 Tax=Daldinia caldariorum TaxID=326644 RepID=UPI002007E1CB|nr:Co-chaperone Hsc20 [Daldinia caldariorum]KAI1467617.1 Co-chaperone Hsc20 [Daldinia caldariorum]